MKKFMLLIAIICLIALPTIAEAGKYGSSRSYSRPSSTKSYSKPKSYTKSPTTTKKQLTPIKKVEPIKTKPVTKKAEVKKVDKKNKTTTTTQTRTVHNTTIIQQRNTGFFTPNFWMWAWFLSRDNNKPAQAAQPQAVEKVQEPVKKAKVEKVDNLNGDTPPANGKK